MSLCIFIFLVLSIIALCCNYRKTSILMLFTTLFVFYSASNGFLPNLLLTALESDTKSTIDVPWGRNNVIIVLGAGTIHIPKTDFIIPTLQAFSRLFAGASQYRSCKQKARQCHIIVSGGDALHTGESEASVYKRELVRLGIPINDILLEPNSMNTYKNAEYTTKLLEEGKFDRAILVTAGIHLKRALLYFSHFNVDPFPVAADYLVAKISWIPTSLNLALTDLALHEYSGILKFYIYNFCGWNAASSSPGAV